jgi:ketosteroid isomerase-like protein
VIEAPFAPPGQPRRYEGRDTLLARAKVGRAMPIRLDEVRNTVIHDTRDPDVIVVEYEIAGVVLPAGTPASAPFIAVLQTRDGQVVRWREYQDTTAMAAALMPPSSPTSEGPGN